MSVSQVSVFLESKPGHMTRILNDFVDAKVSVRGFSASDTGDYGIVRFILDDPDKALQVLKDSGCAAVETKVLCVKLEDKPGELARITGIISDCNINVDYSYSLVSTYIALHVADVDAAEAALASKPVTMLAQEDLKRPVA